VTVANLDQVRARLASRARLLIHPAVVADARAATVLFCLADHRHPLLSGVLPDPDGVLRARWSAE
jgi:hypothetical protein